MQINRMQASVYVLSTLTLYALFYQRIPSRASLRLFVRSFATCMHALQQPPSSPRATTSTRRPSRLYRGDSISRLLHPARWCSYINIKLHPPTHIYIIIEMHRNGSCAATNFFLITHRHSIGEAQHSHYRIVSSSWRRAFNCNLITAS